MPNCAGYYVHLSAISLMAIVCNRPVFRKWFPKKIIEPYFKHKQ